MWVLFTSLTNWAAWGYSHNPLIPPLVKWRQIPPNKLKRLFAQASNLGDIFNCWLPQSPISGPPLNLVCSLSLFHPPLLFILSITVVSQHPHTSLPPVLHIVSRMMFLKCKIWSCHRQPHLPPADCFQLPTRPQGPLNFFYLLPSLIP